MFYSSLSISLRKKYTANIKLSINFIYALYKISNWQIPSTCITNKTNTFLRSKPQQKICFMIFFSEMTIWTPQFSFCLPPLRYKMWCFQSWSASAFCCQTNGPGKHWENGQLLIQQVHPSLMCVSAVNAVCFTLC